MSSMPSGCPARQFVLLLELLKTLLDESRGDAIRVECASYPTFHFVVDQDKILSYHRYTPEDASPHGLLVT